MSNKAHICEFDWCRADRPGVEHWADGALDLSHHQHPEIDKIECYAFVTIDDHEAYDDEISLSVHGHGCQHNAALTVAEAIRLRDLLDTAIANRAQIRGNR